MNGRLALLAALAAGLQGPGPFQHLRTLEDPEIPRRKRVKSAAENEDAILRADEKRQRKAAKRLKESGQ
jgi:hypothetical protein